MDRLGFGVDGRGLGLLLGPVWDEAPDQEIKRTLAGVVVLADGPKLLAGCGVVAGRHVGKARAGTASRTGLQPDADPWPEPHDHTCSPHPRRTPDAQLG